MLVRETFVQHSLLLGQIATASLIAAPAAADIVVALNRATFAGLEFSRVTELMGAPMVSGLLTAATVDVVLDASSGFAYADDLCIYVDVEPFSMGGLLQIGGNSDLGAAQRFFWPNGASSTVGTTVAGTVTLANPLAFSSNPGATPRSIWIGNGWGGSGSAATWSGTVTLHGISLVPAPSALAILGSAVVAGLTRRSRS
jgi:hypothetical protein